MTIRVSYEQAIKAVYAIQQLMDKIGDFLDSQGLEPKADSLAAKELKTFERPKSLRTAYGQGISLVEGAGDHLFSLAKALTEPAQSIAPWTLARAVLESSALSCWLLDPNIDSHLRVGRSLALRYEGFIQQKNFGRAAGQTDGISKVNTRIEDVEAMAEKLGYTKLKTEDGKRTGIGQVMPSVTEIIRDTLDEEANYRLFSAMAHAHQWAYIQLSFKKVEEIELHNNEVVFFEKYLPNDIVLWLCSKTARYFAQPLKYQCELNGWDSKQLNRILDDTYNELRFRQDS